MMVYFMSATWLAVRSTYNRRYTMEYNRKNKNNNHLFDKEFGQLRLTQHVDRMKQSFEKEKWRVLTVKQ